MKKRYRNKITTIIIIVFFFFFISVILITIMIIIINIIIVMVTGKHQVSETIEGNRNQNQRAELSWPQYKKEEQENGVRGDGGGGGGGSQSAVPYSNKSANKGFSSILFPGRKTQAATDVGDKWGLFTQPTPHLEMVWY